MVRHILNGACALVLLLPISARSAPEAQVIANAGRPDVEISRSLVRGMFGMRLGAWPDGAPLRVFVLADEHPVHVEFTETVLRMYPYQLRENWDRLVYSGTGQPPITVSSEEEMVRRVEETPDSIGYVMRLSRDAAVRVLHVR